jgi:hypothetical protein
MRPAVIVRFLLSVLVLAGAERQCRRDVDNFAAEC